MVRALTASLALAASTVVAASPSLAGSGTDLHESLVDCSTGLACTITLAGTTGALEVFAGTSVERIDRSAPIATVAEGETIVVIDGLDPDNRYYFELLEDGATRGAVVADRSLHIETAPNARDIGGYETKDGRYVKWGVVFRSDEISEITDSELLRLADMGIKIVCDFRGPAEVEANGADRVPTGAELVSLPVSDEADETAIEIETAITSKDFEAQERLLGDGRAEQILVDAGPFLVSSKQARVAYGELLERLTDPASLPAFTHCTAGKDRTGWSTAVILTALGVPRATVMEDYLLTNELTAEKTEETIATVTPLMEDPELLRPLLEVQAEYLEGSFDEVESEYGSFARYLRKGLGISRSELRQLKRNLLTD